MITPPRFAASLVAAVLLASALPTLALAQDGSDPLVRAVLAYDLTLPRTEAYVAALKDLTALAKKDPDALKPLRAKGGKPVRRTLEESAALAESVPAVKAILDRHKLRGHDLVILPVALMQAQLLVLGWSQGRDFPGDQLNLRNGETVKANRERFEKLAEEAAALRPVLAGP